MDLLHCVSHEKVKEIMVREALFFNFQESHWV